MIRHTLNYNGHQFEIWDGPNLNVRYQEEVFYIHVDGRYFDWGYYPADVIDRVRNYEKYLRASKWGNQ